MTRKSVRYCILKHNISLDNQKVYEVPHDVCVTSCIGKTNGKVNIRSEKHKVRMPAINIRQNCVKLYDVHNIQVINRHTQKNLCFN